MLNRLSATKTLLCDKFNLQVGAYARPTDFKLIIMLTRYFITSTDTPRHKQVDKKYEQHIVMHKRHTQLRKLDPQNA